MTAYTPIDFDALQSGRDLDELIASKVLGFNTKLDIDRLPWLQPDPKWNNWQRIPYYSTAIEDAWKLVEVMKRKWKHGEDGEPWAWSFTDCAEQGWEADVIWWHHDGTIPITGHKAANLPLAICLCALKLWEEYEGRHG